MRLFHLPLPASFATLLRDSNLERKRQLAASCLAVSLLLLLLIGNLPLPGAIHLELGPGLGIRAKALMHPKGVLKIPIEVLVRLKKLFFRQMWVELAEGGVDLVVIHPAGVAGRMILTRWQQTVG